VATTSGDGQTDDKNTTTPRTRVFSLVRARLVFPRGVALCARIGAISSRTIALPPLSALPAFGLPVQIAVARVSERDAAPWVFTAKFYPCNYPCKFCFI